MGPRLGAEESLLSFREGRHHFARSVCGMKDERCGLLPAVPKEAGLCFVEGRRGAGDQREGCPREQSSLGHRDVSPHAAASWRHVVPEAAAVERMAVSCSARAGTRCRRTGNASAHEAQ